MQRDVVNFQILEQARDLTRKEKHLLAILLDALNRFPRLAFGPIWPKFMA